MTALSLPKILHAKLMHSHPRPCHNISSTHTHGQSDIIAREKHLSFVFSRRKGLKLRFFSSTDLLDQALWDCSLQHPKQPEEKGWNFDSFYLSSQNTNTLSRNCRKYISPLNHLWFLFIYAIINFG